MPVNIGDRCDRLSASVYSGDWPHHSTGIRSEKEFLIIQRGKRDAVCVVIKPTS